MNLKYAKKLRRMVRQMINQKIINDPWTQYEVTNHKRMIPDYVLDEKDNKSPGLREVDKNQRRVNPKSPRGVYKALKKAA